MNEIESLRQEIATLRAQVDELNRRIPKTGLLSQNLLTRMLTVAGYVLVFSVLIPLVYSLVSWSIAVNPAILLIIMLVIIMAVGYRLSR